MLLRSADVQVLSDAAYRNHKVQAAGHPDHSLGMHFCNAKALQYRRT